MLEAQPEQQNRTLRDPSHPRWDERDEKLQRLLAAAGREYDRLWPARYASPGGNPPVVVYAGLPSAKRGAAGEMQVVVPLHCENLVGSVEVLVRLEDTGVATQPELRQFTEWTSKRTLITFTLSNTNARKRHSYLKGEVSILDDSGVVLTRSLATILVC